jgi:hypothetical protein
MRTFAMIVVGALSLIASAGNAQAQVYACEVSHLFSLEDDGSVEHNKTGVHVGARFTIDNTTGAVTGSVDFAGGSPWKLLQSGDATWSLEAAHLRQTGTASEPKPFYLITVLTWVKSPQKPFSFYDVSIASLRTGLCQVHQQRGTFRPTGR